MKIKNILFYATVLGLFATLFIPFIVPAQMYFPFISGKGFTFRIAVEIIFGLYLFLALLAPEYRPKMSWISKSIGIFAIVILLADLLGANAFKSLWSNYERMEGFVLIAHMVLYYIVASSVLKTSSWWNRFWNMSIVASVIMSFYAILQLSGKLTINQGGVRVDGTFGNASYLAIYLVFNIFLCLYMFIQSEKITWKKWLYGLTVVLEMVILYFTATRGAILGFIGGLFLAGILVIFKEKENQRFRKYAYGALIAVVVLVGGFALARNTSFIKKSPVLSRFSTLSYAELQTQGRYYVWPMAIKGFVERPILGWGQENFNFVFNKYYDPRMYSQEQWFDRTHDVVLDWLIAGGLLGLLSYIGLYVALLYYMWGKESSLTLAEKSLFTGMIAAYIFHNLFVFDNLVSYMFFFLVLAFIHSISVSQKEAVGAFYTKTFSPNLNYYVFAPVIAAAVIASVYFINVPAINANVTIIQAMQPQQQGGIEKNLALFKQAFAYNSFGSSEALEQLIQVSTQIQSTPQAPDSIKKEFYDLTKQQIEKKIAATPKDARYLVFAGSFFNRFGQYNEGIKYLEQALANSPKKQTIMFELGNSYLGLGEKQKMAEIFKKAYDIEPDSPESQIIYALGAILTNNQQILAQLAPKISNDVIVNDNRFLQTYAQTGNYQAVINILTLRLQKDPGNAQYKLSLASAYATIGQKQKAIDLLNEIIKENPDFKTQGEQYIKQIQNS